MGEEVDEDEDDECRRRLRSLLIHEAPPTQVSGVPRRLGRGASEVAAERHRRTCDAGLDLDETLVHSQMEPRTDADFVFDVQLCGVTSTVYVTAEDLGWPEFQTYASDALRERS